MNPEKRQEYNRHYRAAHAKALSDAAKAYRKRHDPKVWSANNRRSHLKVWYGLSPEGYAWMMEQQGRACAICHCKDWAGKHPHIDHDHKTGRVRGILCARCNRALGFFLDNSHIIMRALLYLVSHEGEEPVFGNRHAPLTIEELGHAFCVKPGTIKGWIKKYKMPFCTKDGVMLFMPTDVEVWARECNRPTKNNDADKVRKILAIIEEK